MQAVRQHTSVYVNELATLKKFSDLRSVGVFMRDRKSSTTNLDNGENTSSERALALKLHKQLLLVTVALALPFMAWASYLWISAASATIPRMQYETYKLGDLVYKLGSPLTLIVLNFRAYTGRGLENSDNWWAIPLIDVLFVLQWVIWGQLFAFGIRASRTIVGK